MSMVFMSRGIGSGDNPLVAIKPMRSAVSSMAILPSLRHRLSPSQEKGLRSISSILRM